MEVLRVLFFVIALVASVFAARSSEGRDFAIAFAATRSDWSDGFCKMYITAREATSVTIATNSGSNVYQIDPTDTDVFSTTFSTTQFRTFSGVEAKGIRVTSQNADIGVQLINSRESEITEGLLALPRDDNQLEYHIFSHQYESESGCNSGSTSVFYSIIAYEDDTAVEIYVPSAGGQYVLYRTEILDEFEVYTERQVKPDGDDITGMKVVSNKAVTITGGNSCTALHTVGNSDSASHPIWATMPSTEEAGTTFISAPIITNVEGSHPYLLKVLAVTSNTEVSFREIGSSSTLDAGEFVSQEVSAGFEDEVVTCSNPCVVAQYGIADQSAMFMVILPSTSQYVTSSKFTIPATATTTTNTLDNFISIVLLSGNPSSSGISLDGTDISSDSEWVSVGSEYSYLVFEMGSAIEEVHTLESSVPFICLVNGHRGVFTSGNGDGYGFISDSSAQGSLPPSGEKMPLYRIQMNGNYVTSDELDDTCSVTYSQELNTRSTAMIQQVNDRIGTSGLCESYTVNDVSLVSVSSALIVDDTNITGTAYLAFVMNVNPDTVNAEGIESCGQDMSNFLLPHANWPNGDPLPDQPGCPDLTFTSNQFNSSGNVWICPVAQGSSMIDKYATPRYSLGHSGVFSTVDGSTITTECVIGYTNSLSVSTANQLQTVNSKITSGSLCTVGRDGDVTLETATVSVVTDVDQGSSYQTYIFRASGNATSSYLYSCADEVSADLSDHSNWAQPIIAAPSCPEVEFIPSQFTEDSQGWIC